MTSSKQNKMQVQFPGGEVQLKGHKDVIVDHESRASQGINVVFKELIYKLLVQLEISHNLGRRNP